VFSKEKEEGKEKRDKILTDLNEGGTMERRGKRGVEGGEAGLAYRHHQTRIWEGRKGGKESPVRIPRSSADEGREKTQDFLTRKKKKGGEKEQRSSRVHLP